MSEIFFTSDLHFNHRNCALKWRGFYSIEAHNQYIIDKWNSKVGKRDVVYVLGDVSLSVTGIREVRKLNGIKHLILGNHDHSNVEHYIGLFNRIRAFDSIKKTFVLSHIPVHPQNLEYRLEMPNVHGHIHKASETVYNLGPNYFNVNLEFHNYLPLSFDEIKEIMNV